jgi:hypothetical protein
MACCAAIPVITQPPYCPDFAPSDFWLFPILKMGLKGTRFATMENINSNTTAGLGRLKKYPSADDYNIGRIGGARALVCIYVFVCMRGVLLW